MDHESVLANSGRYALARLFNTIANSALQLSARHLGEAVIRSVQWCDADEFVRNTHLQALSVSVRRTQDGTPQRFAVDRWCHLGTMLIAIDGCLGAGKTTVAQGLAHYRSCLGLFEDYEANPFLRAFYQDPGNNSIETEFAFLLLHFHQLKRHHGLIENNEIVADFHLGKDLIYADLNLSDLSAKDVFSRLYAICSQRVPDPTLFVFLSIPDDLLLARIQRRSRDFEQLVNPRYYLAVNRAYESYFDRYSGRKLRIPMEEWDFVEHPELYRNLAERIDGELATT